MAAVARHAAAVRQASDQGVGFVSVVCLSSWWRPPLLVAMLDGDRCAGNVNLLVLLRVERGKAGGTRKQRYCFVRRLITFATARVTAVGFQWVGDTAVVLLESDGLALLLHVYRHML